MRIRTIRLVQALVAVLVTLAVVGPAAPAQAATPPAPHSMASLGDSITRGFNACGWFVDCPSRSWSTGAHVASTATTPGCCRQPAVPAGIQRRPKTGARWPPWPGRRPARSAQGAQYVTILLGANDACTGSESTMTAGRHLRRPGPTPGWPRCERPRRHARRLRRLDPRHQAALAGREGLLRARSAWSLFGICQSMLANPTVHDRRPTSPGATGCSSGSATSTRCSPQPARLRRPLPLRRRRGLRLPVHAVPGEHLGLLPPQHVRPGGAVRRHLADVLRLVADSRNGGGRRPVPGTPASPLVEGLSTSGDRADRPAVELRRGRRRLVLDGEVP